MVGYGSLSMPPSPHLAVLEPQLDLGIVYHLAQVPHGHLPPPLLEHTQDGLLQVLRLILQAWKVLGEQGLGSGQIGPATPTHYSATHIGLTCQCQATQHTQADAHSLYTWNGGRIHNMHTYTAPQSMLPGLAVTEKLGLGGVNPYLHHLLVLQLCFVCSISPDFSKEFWGVWVR